MNRGSTVFVIFSACAMLLLAGCTGKAPEWVGGQDSRYPAKDYLLAVGVDQQRDRAEELAREQLSAALVREIPAGNESVARQWHARAGEASAARYAQAMEAALKELLSRVGQEVDTSEVWLDEDSKVYYVLALLERQRGARQLQALLEESDKSISVAVRQAEGAASPLDETSGYIQALVVLDGRRMVADALATLQPRLTVARAPTTEAEVGARVSAAMGRIRFGVEIQGSQADLARGVAIRKLTGLGMELAPEWERVLSMRGAVVGDAGDGDGATEISCVVDLLGAGGRLLETRRVSASVPDRTTEGARTAALEAMGEALAAMLIEKVVNGGAGEK